jgi:hypothetical protein
MTSYCLNINEYQDIIKVYYYNGKKSSDLEYVHEIFTSCLSWEKKVSGFNYFFSLLIERFMKQRSIDDSLIDYVYTLQDEAHFEIVEAVTDFIEVLFKTYYKESFSLEEKLIDVQNSING